LSQVSVSKVGKKGAVYIPKRICERLGISEEDKVLMRVEGDKLVLEFIPNPLSLAVKIKKWAKTTVEEFEKESEGEHDEHLNEDVEIQS
jgi:AbrB family looped-hinge helix DNA binding protein